MTARLGRGDDVFEGHDLPFAALHVRYVQNVGELETGDALETLLQVRLHSRGILGFRENLEQFVVGQEEEAREVQPFLLEIVVEPLIFRDEKA